MLQPRPAYLSRQRFAIPGIWRIDSIGTASYLRGASHQGRQRRAGDTLARSVEPIANLRRREFVRCSEFLATDPRRETRIGRRQDATTLIIGNFARFLRGGKRLALCVLRPGRFLFRLWEAFWGVFMATLDAAAHAQSVWKETLEYISRLHSPWVRQWFGELTALRGAGRGGRC